MQRQDGNTVERGEEGPNRSNILSYINNMRKREAAMNAKNDSDARQSEPQTRNTRVVDFQ